MRNMTRPFVVVLLLASFAQFAPAQSIDADGKSAIAVADSVLAALSRGDNATLARLTLDSSVVGGAGLRDGPRTGPRGPGLDAIRPLRRRQVVALRRGQLHSNEE